MSASESLRWFRSQGLRPKKQLGQNFLHESTIATAIATLATSPPGGTVLEIGPGLGALTAPLLPRVDRLIAIERDRELVPWLRQEFAEVIATGALVVQEGDALMLPWQEELTRGPAPYRLTGNLPYAITGQLLRRAVDAANFVESAVFMVQREVADRITAMPGTKAYGALSVFVQAVYRPEQAIVVRSGAFWPVPGVESAVLVLSPHRPPRAQVTATFTEAVRRAFAQRRKTLRNAWRGIYGWSPDQLETQATRAGISLDARGETLSVEEFAALSDKIV